MEHPRAVSPRRAAAAALLVRALRVDARGCQEVVARERADGAPPREVARRLVVRSARRAAVVGFVCALPPLPALRVPAAGLEGVVALRARVALAARLSYLRDPAFFDDAAWEARLLGGLLAGRRRAPLTTTSATASVARSFGGRAARWTLEQVTRRAAPRAVPVVGAVFGGASTYGELHRFGEALVRERFGAPDPAASAARLGRLPALYADALDD